MSETTKISNLRDFIQSHGYLTVFFEFIDSKCMVTYKSSQYMIRGKINENTMLSSTESIASLLFEIDRTEVTIWELPNTGNLEGEIIFTN